MDHASERRPLTVSRAAAVVLVHVVIGMPAGTATMATSRDLFYKGSPLDIHELLFGIALAPLFALLASILFLPLLLMPVCGGIAAIVAHSSFGRYRWWTAAVLGVAVGIGFCTAAGALSDPHPGAHGLVAGIVASSVVAMLACRPLTNAILGEATRRAR